MDKQPAMRITVKRTEAVWEPPGRIGSGPVRPHGDGGKQFELREHWNWARVHEAGMHQLDQYISLEPKVLKGTDRDAIHDIRVASRRLQQVLDLVYPRPGPPKVRKIRRTIRRSRRALSIVRNCDVLLEHAERTLSRKRAARREVWSAFRDYVEERREKSFEKASRRLTKLNLPALYLRLKELLEPPVPQTGQEDAPGSETNLAQTNLRQRMTESLQTTWSALEACVEQARETPQAPSLHAVRIAAKKVRYLLEVVQTLEVPGSKQAVATLRRLQQHLGDWHDLEVQDEMMLEMVGRPGFLKARLELAMDVERLVLRNRKIKLGYVEQFLKSTGNSEEWLRLEGWVQGFLAADEVFEQADEPEVQSPAVSAPRA